MNNDNRTEIEEKSGGYFILTKHGLVMAKNREDLDFLLLDNEKEGGQKEMTLEMIVTVETVIIVIALVKKVLHWACREIRHMCRGARLKGRREGNIKW